MRCLMDGSRVLIFDVACFYEFTFFLEPDSLDENSKGWQTLSIWYEYLSDHCKFIMKNKTKLFILCV